MINFYDNFFFGCSGSRKRNAFDDKQIIIQKNQTGLNTFYKLISLVIGRFTYNIPKSCDSRFLEMCYMYDGCAGFIEYEGQPINLEINGSASFDRFGYPNSYNLVDFMGKNYGRFIPDTSSNEGFSNSIYSRAIGYDVVPLSRIYWYAERLTDIQASISAAIANLKGSTIIQCSKEQERVVKRAYQKADNGMPIVLAFGEGEGAFSMDPKVITNPQTPEILTTLQETYDKTFASFLEEFGINANGVINKLSGVSDAELEQNEQSINIKLMNDLNMRKDTMKRCAEMFGGTQEVKLTSENKKEKEEISESNEDEDFDDNIEGGDSDVV